MVVLVLVIVYTVGVNVAIPRLSGTQAFMVQIDYYALQRRVLRASYFEFFKAFWPVISSEPLELNWHIQYLCDTIQDAMEDVFARRPCKGDITCNISPGTSKSSIFSIMLLPWAWTRMPDMRFIGVSFEEKLTFYLADKSRSIVTSPLYQKLFPEIVLDQNSKSFWSNTRGGERLGVTTGGNVTGRHSHCTIVDDPINPKASRSAAECLAANQYCCETLPSRKVNKDVSITILVMQRLSVEDPTALFLSRPNVRHICLPGELTADVSPPELAKYYENGLFDPKRLSTRALKQLRADLGEFSYAGQILQTPIPLSGGMFKVDSLVTDHNFAPDRSEFVKIVRAWDKAASANGGDFTVGALLGHHKDGSFWILDLVRAQLATDKREDLILQTAKKDGKTVRVAIEREPGSAGIDSAKATVKMLAGYLVYPEPSTGSKELRADTLSIQVNNGNVHTAIKGKILDDLKYEMLFFPNGKNDDQIDALSLAFSMLVNRKPKLGVLR